MKRCRCLYGPCVAKVVIERNARKARLRNRTNRSGYRVARHCFASVARTIARMPARIASGSPGQRSVSSISSGSNATASKPESPPDAPDFAPPSVPLGTLWPRFDAGSNHARIATQSAALHSPAIERARMLHAPRDRCGQGRGDGSERRTAAGRSLPLTGCEPLPARDRMALGLRCWQDGSLRRCDTGSDRSGLAHDRNRPSAVHPRGRTERKRGLHGRRDLPHGCCRRSVTCGTSLRLSASPRFPTVQMCRLWQGPSPDLGPFTGAIVVTGHLHF